MMSPSNSKDRRRRAPRTFGAPVMFPALILAAGLLSAEGARAQPPPSASIEADVAPRIAPPKAPLQGPPWLGIALGASDDGEKGVPVKRVMARTPASRAGVEVGDRIIAIDGQETPTASRLQRVTSAHRPGDRVRVDLFRGKRRREIFVTLEEQPTPEEMVNRQLMGRPAPDFEVQTVVGDAKTKRLSAWRGKPTIVEFWATWCGPCRRVSRELSALAKLHGDAIHIVAVSAEAPSTLEAHARTRVAPYTIVHDLGRKGHDAYMVMSFPMVVLLDADHQVRGVFFGAHQTSAMAAKLQSLVSAPTSP